MILTCKRNYDFASQSDSLKKGQTYKVEKCGKMFTVYYNEYQHLSYFNKTLFDNTFYTEKEIRKYKLQELEKRNNISL